MTVVPFNEDGWYWPDDGNPVLTEDMWWTDPFSFGYPGMERGRKNFPYYVRRGLGGSVEDS